MNPWENNRLGTGTIFEYLQVAQIDQIVLENDLIETQKKILTTMDEYENLAADVKSFQDSEKVGEFIDPEAIRHKARILNRLSKHLGKITQNSDKFIEKSLQASPGNQLYIELEYQRDFFKTIEVAEDQSLLSIATQANKIHDTTISKLHGSLSGSPASISKKAVNEVFEKAQELSTLKKKYSLM